MTDANVTELRPSPAKGEMVRAKPKDRTATERKRRSRARKRNQRDNARGHAVTVPPVTIPSAETVTSHAVTPAQQPFKTNQKAIDIAAYFSAVTLAGCAAWFSIRGMTVLFPGAPIAVVAMAIAMETAKLVTAGWLANDGAGVASRPNDPRGRARGHQRHSGLCPAGCRARRGTGGRSSSPRNTDRGPRHADRGGSPHRRRP